MSGYPSNWLTAELPEGTRPPFCPTCGGKIGMEQDYPGLWIIECSSGNCDWAVYVSGSRTEAFDKFARLVGWVKND